VITEAADRSDHAGPTERGGRSASSWVLILLGYACIVAGGLVAAVTGPLQLQYGSWAAAYLVLVGGIAQLALGWVPGEVGRPEIGRRAWIIVTGWNLGNALVIGGTLTALPLGVDVGSLLLVLALILAIIGLVRPRGGAVGSPRGWRVLLRVAYLCLLVVLAISIPVGILLTYLRD
jgi:hypothetical protein